MNVDSCCIKKRKCTEYNLHKHFCSFFGPLIKKCQRSMICDKIINESIDTECRKSRRIYVSKDRIHTDLACSDGESASSITKRWNTCRFSL